MVWLPFWIKAHLLLLAHCGLQAGHFGPVALVALQHSLLLLVGSPQSLQLLLTVVLLTRDNTAQSISHATGPDLHVTLGRGGVSSS